MKLETPDVTRVQKLGGAVVAFALSLLGVLSAFGVDVTTEQTAAIGGCLTALVSVFVIADAVIRNGRAKATAAGAFPDAIISDR